MNLIVYTDDSAIKPYNIYVFHINVVNTDELSRIWNILSNDIAFYFQSELEKDIEIWNIYIFYFLNEGIINDSDKVLKFKIENDTYSARKIVIENSNNNFGLLIKERLFNELVIEKTVLPIELSLSDKIGSSIYHLIENKTTKDIKKIVDHLLNDDSL